MSDLSSAFSNSGEEVKQPFTSKLSKVNYIGIGAVLNILICSLAFIYLRVTPKTYQSEWGVNVLGSTPRVDVSLPEGLRASTTPEGFKQLTSEDPRADYVYLLNSPDLIKKTADRLNLSVEDFGTPTITTDEESSIIGFSLEGETPESAQEKSWALYTTLQEQIEKLRQTELLRRRQITNGIIEQARKQVERSQNELIQLQISSGLSSDVQIDDLAIGIEQLRRQYAQAVAQERGLNSRLLQLEEDIGNASNGAIDIYKLEGDPVYQNQFQSYGIVAAEYTNLATQLGPNHPQLIAKRAELDGLLAAIEDRSSFLLGRPMVLSELTQLSAMGRDPSLEVSRSSLFQSVISDRANQVELQAQLQELSTQIIGFEDRLRRLSQKKVEIDRLELDLQASEALFASSVAKLNLNQDDIYSIYPPIQLASEPTLPEEEDYISPNPVMVIVGALAASFLVTTGLMLLWTNSLIWRNSLRRKNEGVVESIDTSDFPFLP